MIYCFLQIENQCRCVRKNTSTSSVSISSNIRRNQPVVELVETTINS